MFITLIFKEKALSDLPQSKKLEVEPTAPACSVVPEELEVHYRLRTSGVAELAIPLPRLLDLEQLVRVASRNDPARLIEQLWAAVARQS